MAEAKSSGLRLPSKIGRPCCAAGPKPSIPPSPPRSLANSRRLCPPHAMKTTCLTILEHLPQEPQFPRLPGFVACCPLFKIREPTSHLFVIHHEASRIRSAGSANSMEHLWETHGRRLSEAGLRRGSDTSVILTEDTDSFIIGDRVWVGGTKPGLIAYIGETQFAPGDWAGIVLDDPIGKNDGSVAGSRYFQCGPKRGVFSRLTRLTRQPLTEAMSSSMYSSAQRAPTSPTESTRGNLSKSMSPSLNTSTTSLSSMSHRELRLGERVIVSSSQGSKAGVLRFIGSTEFASGEWCGVELDDPVGKNDGAVGEKRYFECRPKHGLFAPVHKVSRSPSNKRSSTCVVHKPSGAALSMSLRKLGSRESLVSVSSIASTTASTAAKNATTSARKPGLRTSTPVRNSMQEMLKDKQIEIEYLHKERDLERERVTRAANQADQAEQMVILLRLEHEKYREDMEKKIQEAQLALAKLLDEKSLLVAQLEEERRKSEDLLFRYEEESINKDDIQEEKTAQNVTNTLNENKIKELEQKLSEERERVVQLEQESVKLFEVEEELTKLRTELSTTASQDESASKDFQELQKLLEETQKSLQHKDEEKSVLIAKYDAEIKLLQAQLTDNENIVSLLKHSESTIKSDLDHAKQSLDSRNSIISEMSRKFDFDTTNLKQKLEQYQLDIENITKQNTVHEELVAKYEETISEKENVIKTKNEQLDAEMKRNLETQQLNLKQIKDDNMKHIEELSNRFKNQLDDKELQLEKLFLQLKEKNLEVKQLQTEIQNFNLSKDDQLQKASAQLNELNGKLKLSDESNRTLTNQIQVLQSKIEEDYQKNNQQKKRLEQDIADLHKSSQETLSQLKNLTADFSKKEIELVNLSESRAKEIEKLTKAFTDQIAAKEQNLTELTSESVRMTDELQSLQKTISNLELTIAQKNHENEQLLKKYTELENNLSMEKRDKVSIETEVQTFTATIADLNQKLVIAEEKISLLIEQKKKLELDISNFISSSADSSDQLTKYNDDLRKKERELDEAHDKIRQLQNSFDSTQNQLDTVQQDLKKSQQLNQEVSFKVEEIQRLYTSEKKLNEELTMQLTSTQSREQELLQIIDQNKELSVDLEKTCTEVSQLNIQLVSCREEIEELRKKNLEVQKLHDEVIEKSNNEKISSDKRILELDVKLEEFSQELKLLQQSKQKLENELNGREQSINELAEKLNCEAESKADLNKLLLDTNSKLSQSGMKIQALQEEINALDSNIKFINVKYNDCLTEIALLKSANDNSASEAQMKLVTVEKQLAHITTENESLTKSLAQISKVNSELNTTYIDSAENNKALKGKLLDIESLIVTKDNIISELNAKLISIEESAAQSKNDSSKVNESLKQELNSALEEKSRIQETIKSLEHRLLDTQNNLSAKEKSELELISKIENLTKVQEKSLRDMKCSKDHEIQHLRSEMEKVASKNMELSQNMDALKTLITTKEAVLGERELVIEKLNEKIKQIAKLETEKLNSDQEFETKLTSQQSELDCMSKQNADLHTAKEFLTTSLQEKQNRISALEESLNIEETKQQTKNKEFLDKLNLTSAELMQLKEAHSLLQQEFKKTNEKWIQGQEALKLATQRHKDLQDVDVVTNNQSIHAAGGDTNKHKNNASSKDSNNDKLLEEYELAQGQIEFLNSVIVDMKKKNDALMCKVEVLEMGIPPSEADDYNLNSINARIMPPRLFCDICDQFDLHDTEDCPRQAQGSPEPVTSARTPTRGPIERPYCDICEAFGHDTADCDDGETF
ncbi:CAP-Gly domain-containing linker protein 2 isoform X4 [Athalia rosae]|uniref:CAP-Gly domain-containing linker protein 2 isoform X4 n=1 Tax=Athalia rosae TaxID=37344 RepID=UPI0020335F87|nr:CAP-Gly domain-containing linker protein 2 isoform X4 [Athalia rosae]